MIEAIDAAVHHVGYFVAGGILVNEIDEFHMDAQYVLRGLFRPATWRMGPGELEGGRKRIAILVPAWKEDEVIEEMLEHNLRTLDYEHELYHFFCGTYPNDVETQIKVDAVAARFPNVHRVTVPNPGPTSKADCLNAVYLDIVREEERTGQRFDILLMHDAEDVIHPQSLRLYASLIPKHEFVQTPVFSLPLSVSRVVASTYIDEFAEHHLKEMRVREAIGGLVPSAGVGSAFARDAFDEIALAHNKQPFNVESLTEDYEIGLKFRLANKRVHFACNELVRDGAREYIATREYFPSGFRASIRQRSRWILGITLQTWAQVGWKGSLPVLYCLFRDRKALWTNAFVATAYALILYVALRGTVSYAMNDGTASFFANDAALAWLLAFNLSNALWRAAVKTWFVGSLYGPVQALVSVPRLVVGNIIGILATARAVGQYTRHRVTGKPLRWLKTSHVFLRAPNAQLEATATSGAPATDEETIEIREGLSRQAEYRE
jgi:adsorption protein B